MTDFKDLFSHLLSPEEKEKRKQRKFEEARLQQELSSMTNAELAEKVRYYMKNSFGHQRVAAEYRDNPVYDSVLWYILLPIVLERLEKP